MSAPRTVRFFMDSPQLRKFIADTGIRPMLEDTIRFIARNPRATTGIGVVCLFLSMPFIMFVLFAMCTLMVTFTGFLIVEGALITFASVLLFSFVGAVVLTGICGATAVTAAYFGCHFLYRIVDYHRKVAMAAMAAAVAAPAPADRNVNGRRGAGEQAAVGADN